MILWNGWSKLFDLFFPRLCAACNNLLLDDEKHICLSCLYSLPYTNFHRRADNPVAELFADKVQIEDATAFLFYNKGSNVQRMIHSLKYYGDEQLAYHLGRQAILNLQEHAPYTSLDYLIPVPLHRKKERARGYNQSEWICQGIASVLHVPICSTAIQRHLSTKTQTRRGIEERWLNVRNAFSLNQAEGLAGKSVLLVDDVVTSGATLRACAEALAAVPDIRIHILAIATPPDRYEAIHSDSERRFLNILSDRSLQPD
ncbi:MAG: ComF family protein [Tannerellaceae bacterium]|jgi:ComF family protein|nr:ComF family protein [Tannerellaceae bacterium]